MNRRTFVNLASTASLSGLLPVLPGSATAPERSVANHVIDNQLVDKYTFPEFDLYRIPFSFAGSYLTIGKATDQPLSRLKLNTVRRTAISFKWQATYANDLLALTLVKAGQEVSFSTVATPWSLELTGAGVSATIAFADGDTLAIRVQNGAVRLLPTRDLSWQYPLPDNGTLFFDGQSGHYGTLKTIENQPVAIGRVGSGALAHDEIQTSESPDTTLYLSMVTDETPFAGSLTPVDALVRRNRTLVETWMAGVAVVPARFRSAAQTGWYLFWNLQVAPAGGYTRQTVLSSKKSMSMIWSWDICFNALALVKTHPRLAWDQLFAILDHQKPNGLLPDNVSDLTPYFGYNKPPVWGWAIRRMLEHTPRDQWRGYLAEAYPKVVLFTNWWFAYRDFGKTGVCAYVNGNDSGWDNATVFDARLPTETPDLTAWLVLQTDALAFMAGVLNKPQEAARWKRQSARLLTLFHNTFVGPDQSLLVRERQRDGTIATRPSTSLLTRIPLVLGQKLNPAVRARITADLSEEGVFLTPNGVASEALTSPKYEPNGYWRGPVWAPSTYLIVEGLKASGELPLARTIAERFCTMVSYRATFAENYNARTGDDQYDTGLTWTSSDFLLLAGWLAESAE